MWNPDQVYASEQARRAELYVEADTWQAAQVDGAMGRSVRMMPIVHRRAVRLVIAAVLAATVAISAMPDSAQAAGGCYHPVYRLYLCWARGV